MAIQAGVCDSYLKELFSGVHTNTDVYKIALYTSSAIINSTTTTTYTVDNEVSGAGYTTGGVILSGFSTTIDNGVSILSFNNVSWENSTITARGAIIYNVSKSSKAVAVLDFLTDISTAGTDFIIEFPSPTATNGLIRIS